MALSVAVRTTAEIHPHGGKVVHTAHIFRVFRYPSYSRNAGMIVQLGFMNVLADF